VADDTAELVVQLSAIDGVWAGPLLSSLQGRVFFLRLFKESLRMVIEKGDHGTRLVMVDQGGDRFELHTGDRVVAFERSPTDGRVLVSREGFPVDLVPIGLERELLVAPEDSDEGRMLADQQVKSAVRMLFRRRD